MSKNIQFQERETASWPSLATLFLGDYCSASVQHRLRFCSYSNTPHKKGVIEPGKELQHQMRVTQKKRVFTRKPQLFLLSVVDRYLSIGAKTEKSTRGGGAGKVAQWVKEPVPSLSSTPRIHILEREK